MIHISRTKKGQLTVTNIAKNGKVLKPSETVESKQGCWRNIKSELLTCYSPGSYAIVQDNTGKKPIVYLVGEKRVVANGIKPQTPHVPK